jgi:hypothetical protein
MKHKGIIGLMTMLFVLFACQSDDMGNVYYSDYILFGHFFGECGGEVG